MSTQTKNYGLIKDDIDEFYDVLKVNNNLDKIDTEFKKNADAITTLDQKVESHKVDGVKHLTSDERTAWNSVKTRFPPICSTITDINNITENGLYMGASVANAPDTNWYMFEVIKHNDSWVYQKAIGFTQGANVIYERVKQSGVWQPWFSLFQYANDGKTAVANAVTAKGVSASPSDTFSALASKIGQINTGKRWASGTFTYANGIYKFAVNNLNFRPSTIIVVQLKYVPGGPTGVAYYSDVTGDNFTALGLNGNYGSSNPYPGPITSQSNGFTFDMVISYGSTMNWVAYE